MKHLSLYLHANRKSGKVPSKKGGVPCILIRSFFDPGEVRQFFMGDFPFFPFPMLFQREMRQDLNSVMLAHFNDFSSGFMVGPNVLCYLFSPAALVVMIITFSDKPTRFNENNQRFPVFGATFFYTLQIIQ